jgi:hypothetical protein
MKKWRNLDKDLEKKILEVFVWPNDARWPARIIKTRGC